VNSDDPIIAPVLRPLASHLRPIIPIRCRSSKTERKGRIQTYQPGMNHRDFQSFLDTVASRRPKNLPFQKLRILNEVAIHQKEGALPTEARLIDSLLMQAETFNRLVVELIREDLLKMFQCSWDGHRRLLVLTEMGATRVDSLISQFRSAPSIWHREHQQMCA